jgi:hypothetical protein
MYYNVLGVTQDADDETIKAAYFARYRPADPAARTLINKAKDCLSDEASRTAYDKTLAKFGIKDGVAGGFVEVHEPEPPTAVDGAESQFEVTYGEEMTECIASNLETLQQEAGEGLDLAKGTFLITYMYKGKKVVVRTQGNYKIMVSKQPNAEGNFEVNCELIEVEKAKPEPTPVSIQQAKPEPTIVVKKPPAGLEYSPPDIAQMRPENVYDHLSDLFYPYTTELARAGLLTSNGKKTVEIFGLNQVTGMMYNGVLTGFGSYVDSDGTKCSGAFYRDLRHGNVHMEYTEGSPATFMFY